MQDLVHTAFKIDRSLLDEFDTVLSQLGLNRSQVVRAAMLRCVERGDAAWLLVPADSREERCTNG